MIQTVRLMMIDAIPQKGETAKLNQLEKCAWPSGFAGWFPFFDCMPMGQVHDWKCSGQATQNHGLCLCIALGRADGFVSRWNRNNLLEIGRNEPDDEMQALQCEHGNHRLSVETPQTLFLARDWQRRRSHWESLNDLRSLLHKVLEQAGLALGNFAKSWELCSGE